MKDCIVRIIYENIVVFYIFVIICKMEWILKNGGKYIGFNYIVGNYIMNE